MHLRFLLAVVLMLCVVLPQAPHAADLDDALAALKRRDYATALPLVRPFAKRGNRLAQFMLATLLDGGFDPVDVGARSVVTGLARDVMNNSVWSVSANGRKLTSYFTSR